MSTPWVATRQDLHTRLPASACVPEARQLAGVVVASNALDLPAHGLTTGDLVSLAARTGATLDSAIDPVTEYPVTVINGRFFRLQGITLAGNGRGLPWLFVNVDATIDRILVDRTSHVIASAIAYRGPWYTPPGWAPGLVADLAAPIVARALRIESARYDVAAVTAAAIEAEKFVEMLRGGAVFGDGVGPIDSTDGQADDAAWGTGRAPLNYLARVM